MARAIDLAGQSLAPTQVGECNTSQWRRRRGEKKGGRRQGERASKREGGGCFKNPALLCSPILQLPNRTYSLQGFSASLQIRGKTTCTRPTSLWAWREGGWAGGQGGGFISIHLPSRACHLWTATVTAGGAGQIENSVSVMYSGGYGMAVATEHEHIHDTSQDICCK